MNDPTALMEWIERLGGWVVVLLIVRWMMVRIDTMIDQQNEAVASFKESLASFKAFEHEERKTHNAIESAMSHIMEELRDLRRNCETFKEKPGRPK